MNALGYIRVSSAGQVEKDGPVRQREAITATCSKYGYKFLREYADEGKTGDCVHGFISEEELTHRDGFLQMLRDIRDGVHGNPEELVVVMEKLNRLSRWQPLQEILIEEMRKLGVQITTDFEGEGIATDDPTKVFIRQVFGAVAQLDKSNLVHQMRKARERKRSRGERCEGTRPYGQHPKYPEEVIVLNRILDLSEQLSSEEIAFTLNKEGTLTRKGSLWNSGTICKIVRRSKAKATVA